MITSAEFVERMKSLKPNCYMHGKCYSATTRA